MNKGELNSMAIKAAAIKIIRTLFLYFNRSLHRYVELKVSFCLSSIKHHFSNKLPKIRKIIETAIKKMVLGYFFSAGRTSETISLRLKSLVTKIKHTLMAKPTANETIQFQPGSFTSHEQRVMLPRNSNRCSQ